MGFEAASEAELSSGRRRGRRDKAGVAGRDRSARPGFCFHPTTKPEASRLALLPLGERATIRGVAALGQNGANREGPRQSMGSRDRDPSGHGSHLSSNTTATLPPASKPALQSASVGLRALEGQMVVFGPVGSVAAARRLTDLV